MMPNISISRVLFAIISYCHSRMAKEQCSSHLSYLTIFDLTIFEVAIFTAAIWLSGLLGKNPQAANQIALNLSSMTFMVAMGLSVASMIRVGNQKGLQHYFELRRIAFSLC